MTFLKTLNFIIRATNHAYHAFDNYSYSLFLVIRRGAVAVYQLTGASKNRDTSGYVNPPATFVGVYYARGPDNHPQGALSFRGTRNSYVLIPNNGCLDTRYSLTIIMWVYPESSGPLLHFNPKGWGVHVWIISQFRLFARFVPRSRKSVTAVYKKIKPRQWNYIAASYDRRTGLATLWLDSLPLIQRKIGTFRRGLATNYPIVIGSKPGDRRKFRGRIACVQMYNYVMSAAQIRSKKKQCFRAGACEIFCFLFILVRKGYYFFRHVQICYANNLISQKLIMESFSIKISRAIRYTGML